MRHAAVVLCAYRSAACAPLPRPVVASPRPPLSGTEQAVVAAVLKAEVESNLGERPVMLLDETSSWMPPAENGSQCQTTSPATSGWLRISRSRCAPQSKRHLVSVGSAALVDGVAVFPRGRFERMNRSRRGLRTLAKPFGGREPVVLEASRPVVDEQGTAHALVHVYSHLEWLRGDQYIRREARGRRVGGRS